MYNLNHLLKVLYNSFAIDSFFLYDGESMHSSNKQPVCKICPLNIHKQCLQSWHIGSTISNQLNEPYLYFCPLGLSFIIISGKGDDNCLHHDLLAAGPVVIEGREVFRERRWNPRGTGDEEIPFESIRRMDEKSFTDIAELVFLAYNGTIYKNRINEVTAYDHGTPQYKSLTIYDRYHLRNIFNYLSRLAQLLYGDAKADDREFDDIAQKIVDVVWYEECSDIERTRSKFGQIVSYLYSKYIESGFEDLDERTVSVKVNAIESADGRQVMCDAFFDAVRLMYRNKGATASRENALIKRMQDVLSDCYAEQITLADIASRLNVSYTYISNMINREMSMTFNHYLKDLRVQASKPFLRDTSMSIAEIAAKVGFADQSHFSKSFKSICGLTPTKYREERKP